MGDRVRIQHNKRLFVQGCILAALGVAGPALIMEEMLGIYDERPDSGGDQAGGYECNPHDSALPGSIFNQ